MFEHKGMIPLKLVILLVCLLAFLYAFHGMALWRASVMPVYEYSEPHGVFVIQEAVSNAVTTTTPADAASLVTVYTQQSVQQSNRAIAALLISIFFIIVAGFLSLLMFARCWRRECK